MQKYFMQNVENFQVVSLYEVWKIERRISNLYHQIIFTSDVDQLFYTYYLYDHTDPLEAGRKERNGNGPAFVILNLTWAHLLSDYSLILVNILCENSLYPCGPRLSRQYARIALHSDKSSVIFSPRIICLICKENKAAIVQ